MKDSCMYGNAGQGHVGDSWRARLDKSAPIDVEVTWQWSNSSSMGWMYDVLVRSRER